jgi:hypothetical protein
MNFTVMILAAIVEIRISYVINQDGDIDEREIELPTAPSTTADRYWF